MGPFKAVNFKIPTKQTEDMYIKSVDATVGAYAGLLRAEGKGELDLPNRDCDTGAETRAGEYSLADETYAHLTDELTKKNPDSWSSALRDNLLQFYSDPMAPVATKKNAKEWRKLQDELDTLRKLTAAALSDDPF